LIVPKRLARAASLRNAIKRQGREAFRLAAFAIPPCDVVLRLTRPVKGVSSKDGAQRKVWRAEIETLLRRFLA
jgi:ribonuclease P protein component